MAVFASAAAALALGIAAGPAAGVGVAGTAGADWIGMLHLEGAGWAHLGAEDVVHPLATTKAEVAWIARAGEWRFGPSLAMDVSFAGEAEQFCTGIGGCRYPGRAGGLGAWASFRGWEAWAGVGAAADHDTMLWLPRLRVDWTSESGWVIGGFFSPGRETISLHFGRAFRTASDPRPAPPSAGTSRADR